MRLYLIVLLLACCVGFASAQEDKPLIPEYFSGEFDFGGFKRSYALVPPQDFDAEKSYPLVVVFHGAGGSGIELLKATGLKDLASEQGYLIAFPNGVEQGWGYLDKEEQHTREVYTEDWNFFTALVDDTANFAQVDPSRVYVIGFSNGGSLAYRIMCEHPDRVAGVVVIASTLSSYTADQCINTAPVPLMMVLGTADRTFPFGGSAEIKSDGRLILQFSFQQQMTFLAQHQKCSLAGGTTSNVNSMESPIRVVRDFYDQCPGGAPILLYALIDYEHGYGGLATIVREDGTAGTLENAMFDFFAAYPAPEESAD
jgi:polyhydroxybutyrate depolymerase